MGHKKTLVYPNNQPIADVQELKRKITVPADQINLNLSSLIGKIMKEKDEDLCQSF